MSNKVAFLFLVFTFLTGVHFLNAQSISGKVYRDYNGNGALGNGATNTEPGIGGIIVNIYNSSDILIASYLSNSAGNFSVPASGTAYNGTQGSNTGFVPNGTKVRLEFVVPNVNMNGSPNYLTFSSKQGNANETSVQFITAGSGTSNIRFAVNNPAHYTDASPRVGYAIMSFGNQTSGPNQNKDVLFHMTYAQGNVMGNDSTGKVAYTKAKNIGATFGLAFQRCSKSFFVASLMKRHIGFGPSGTGAIYRLNTVNNSVSTFVDLNALYGANFAGIDPHPTNNSQTSWDKDSLSWDYVGKISWGDIDISEDEQFLWGISLTDRKLYKMPIGSLTNPVPPTAAQITRYPATGNLTGLPGLTGTNLASDIRPFGLGIRNGLVYIGLVHSAQTSQLTSELRAFVYEFNPATAVFTKVMDFPLNYTRGRTVNSPSAFLPAAWQPWKSAFTAYTPVFSNEFSVPQPILSDINFVEDKMVLGFKDRYGDQMGYRALSTTGDDNVGNMYNGDTAGDILFASPNGSGSWTVENNSESSPPGIFGPTSGQSTNQGPGGGEFLFTEKFPVSATTYALPAPYIIHDEVSLGGIAQIPGSNEIVTTIYDPVDDINTAFDGGIAWFNTNNGTRKRAFITYNGANGAQSNNFFGKANGMGDIEILSTPAPVEIGNRIWLDSDQDGVQDANEEGLGGITLELFADFDANGVPDGAALGSTVTASTGTIGTWYFNTANVADGDPGLTGVQAGPQPFKSYIVRITAADWASGAGVGALNGATMTIANSTSGAGVDDEIDSDAYIGSAGLPQILVTNGFTGQNNHSYDFGFVAQGSVGNYVWNDINGDGIQNEPASGGINGVTVQLWGPGVNGVIGGGDDVLIASTVTASNSGSPGYYNFVIAYQGDYYVKFPASNGANIITNKGWNLYDDTNSDADATSGETELFTMNVVGTGTSKNNPTVDVGYTDCLTLKNLVVHACTNVGGVGMSRVDITVNVPSPGIHGWDASLLVSTAGISHNLILYNANNFTLSFLLPSNGQTDTIVAEIIPNATLCNKKVKIPYTLPVNCVPNPCGAAGTLGGYVFKDANGNGFRDSGEMGLGSGVQNVTVTVFDDNVLVAQTTTNQYGQYTFTGLSNIPYRVEFTGYPSGLLPSQSGSGNGTNVQFVSPPDCDVNFALMFPADYCQDDPYVLSGVYSNGNPTISGASNSGNLGWFYRWHYDDKDSFDMANANFGYYNYKTSFADSLFQGNQIGAVWGVTYNNTRKEAYASAVLRRHAGYGPLGSGGIYKINLSTATPSISNWINFDALGIPTGNAVVNNTTRLLPAGTTTPNNDSLAFDGVGKYSFGGMDIAEDNSKLFIMNLFDRKLYIIDISGGGTPTLANITSVSVPVSSCNASNNTFRPWAVKYYHGKVYIGGVCSGENQPIQWGFPDMTATIYSLDPSNLGAGFTQVFSYPLNYRSYTNWHSTFYDEYQSSPMLTAIEFEQDNSMILGMLDRKGYQFGTINYPPSGSYMISAQSSGDILRVHNNNGTYVMEDDGISGPLVGSGTSTSEPLSYGRGFFEQGAPLGGAALGVPPSMNPAAQGALALKPGSGEVITSFGDIINYNSGGTGVLSTQNGKLKSGYELFNTNGSVGLGKMGKAAGMGDIELMCNAAPIEVGNYVWADTDADGIQDPSESGIQGVEVRLYNHAFVLVGKTSTNLRGEYYFNMGNVDTTGVNATTGAPNTGYTGLNYNRTYYIVIGKNGQFNATSAELTVGSASYILTAANSGQGVNKDINDSDASLASAVNAVINGFPYISFVSGSAGSTNHTYDFGFKAVGSIGNYVWNDVNGNGLQDEGVSGGINGIAVHLWSAGTNGVMGGGDDYIIATTVTASNASGNPGYYNFIVETSGNYFVQFPTSTLSYGLTTQNAAAATDGNSDPLPSSGLSPVFTITVTGTGTAKNNTTIDAGYKCLIGNCLPMNGSKI
ncbi:MAG: hypothetical protein K1X92_07480 [Bacteroidia bacterium]|nr:hypothetical protein [Bacteroidia bacterium]